MVKHVADKGSELGNSHLYCSIVDVNKFYARLFATSTPSGLEHCIWHCLLFILRRIRLSKPP